MTVTLPPRQERFIEEYLIDLNGTQAAIRAGYSPKTATEQASRLLTNVNVARAIVDAQKKLAAKTGISQERVLKEYAKLAFLDIRKAFDERGYLKPLQDIDDDTAAAIAGIETEEKTLGNEEDSQLYARIKKLKLTDKKGALDSIGRHLGMFTDKTEHSGPNGGPLHVAGVAIYVPDNGRDKRD